MPGCPPPVFLFWGPWWWPRPIPTAWWRWWYGVRLVDCSFGILGVFIAVASEQVASASDPQTHAPGWGLVAFTAALWLLALWGGIRMTPAGTRLWSLGWECVILGGLGTVILWGVALNASPVGESVLGHAPPRVLMGVGLSLLLAVCGGLLVWRFPWNTDPPVDESPSLTAAPVPPPQPEPRQTRRERRNRRKHGARGR